MTGRLSRRALTLLLVALALLLAGCIGSSGDPTATPTPSPTPATASPTPTAVHPSYANTTVTVFDDETGEKRGRVEAAIADDRSLRYTGLSETARLPADRGMLFVYDEPQAELTYVMRNMSFPLDIVFVHDDGTIQSIHHVRAPQAGEDGESITASGEGQYVLEVNRGWTTDRGVEAGDRLEFELPDE
ncbi:DUF192 domain-containing protein [Halobacteriales archaeon QS_1_69_70]|nr:MAG: DUF192 domain-containing protein [Halobacteriales archaeon QS_1_69_70]